MNDVTWKQYQAALDYFDDLWEHGKHFHTDMCSCPDCCTCRDWEDLPWWVKLWRRLTA